MKKNNKAALDKISETRYSNSTASIAGDFAEHLKYDEDAMQYYTSKESEYKALAKTIRDRIIHKWDDTRERHEKSKSKKVCYLSLEFLIGRAMTNNVINLGIKNEIMQALSELGYSYEELADLEPDAGLGNGGLGRLAACFLDSMATKDINAVGYGIRYNYGIFNQVIANGYQFEQPDNWLRYGNQWEIPRSNIRYTVNFGGHVQVINENGRDYYKWINTEKVIGTAYDIPIVGYGGETVNTLRLWSAKAVEDFNFQNFDNGDYTQAVRDKVLAENISQVLYPNDKQYTGKVLRLKQQYFFVCCSIADILANFNRDYPDKPLSELPEYTAIQLNDTHPSIAIAELMRVLIDMKNLEWDKAWEITTKTMGYTNHTLLPEALEKWPVPMFESILPRHLQIIYEINRRFLQNAISFFSTDSSYDENALSRVSIIEESNPKNIRMANLAIIGSHQVNGVAKLHTDLLKQVMFPEFNLIYPNKFLNVTNGITPRRWLLSSNPALSSLITEAIGDKWITDASELKKLIPFADDSSFCKKFAEIKSANKRRAEKFLIKDCGIHINPNTMFDVQVKRIHEYKRQLLNAFNIVLIYQRLKNNSAYFENFQPTTFLFGGKSAPGYENAKLSIKFINNLAQVINSDNKTKDKLQIHFIPNYRVTMAEVIIPATNLSEQISTAGMEASGTGNMKFMLNGALTIGTLDGANVEIRQEAGKENIFIFGHTEDEIASLRPFYNPWNIINADEELSDAVNLIRSDFFKLGETDVFNTLFDRILNNRDPFFIFADLKMYSEAHDRASDLYKNNFSEFNKKAVINVASAGHFSSDRTISEYAQRIWNL